MQGLFIASTGQHVGKTTICLGLLSGLKKRYARVGFMKPVGQEHVMTEGGIPVDKDVILFQNHFHLDSSFKDMSPVLFPRGFTKRYLDGEIDNRHMTDQIISSYQKIQSSHPFTLVEGTGHTGVGSIVDLNNAHVAKLLNLPVILVASGGLGSAFDELTLGKTLCDAHGVKVKGVILNRVLHDKRDMITHYMNKALKRWDISLLGCVPYDPFLSSPSMKDFELLFETPMMTGEAHRLRHFKHSRLVATSVDNFRSLIMPNMLVITPANREDIILALLTKHWDVKILHPDEDLQAGMILTGNIPPKSLVVDQIKKANIPMIYTPLNTSAAMKMISSHIAKIAKEDTAKIHEAIDLVESHIDFDRISNL